MTEARPVHGDSPRMFPALQGTKELIKAAMKQEIGGHRVLGSIGPGLFGAIPWGWAMDVEACLLASPTML